MLKITFEGPQGCGKTLAAFEVVKWAHANGLSSLSVDEHNLSKKVIDDFPVDVLIIEKQTR